VGACFLATPEVRLSGTPVVVSHLRHRTPRRFPDERWEVGLWIEALSCRPQSDSAIVLPTAAQRLIYIHTSLTVASSSSPSLLIDPSQCHTVYIHESCDFFAALALCVCGLSFSSVINSFSTSFVPHKILSHMLPDPKHVRHWSFVYAVLTAKSLRTSCPKVVRYSTYQLRAVHKFELWHRKPIQRFVFNAEDCFAKQPRRSWPEQRHDLIPQFGYG